MQNPSIILGALALLASAGAARSATNEEIFRQRMRPVLVKNCGACHMTANPAGGLSMAGWEALLSGGKHGPALVPGAAKASLLVQYLRGEKSPKMPLGQSLPATEEAELIAAIDAMQPLPPAAVGGGRHAAWLFGKPTAPVIPSVRRMEWIRNPIDAFLLARLEGEGLQPAPAADRRTLIRRLYFDLVGVPPAPAEVENFVNDSSPQAYEKLVDRLLEDPNHGERWGRHWLDLARFAESDGFAIDGERPTAWRYRDYVIRAFQQDKPYDLFVKEQLAGDEMNDKRAKPEDRSERIVALGFLRMGTWEADANFKTQLRQDFLNDITATASQVFLGLTTGCARCHDHKYDPIPQKDFYRLQAFFAATKPDDRPAPHLKVEDPAGMKQKMRQHEDEAEAAAQRFKRVEEEYKQKYIAAKHLQPGDKAADEFRRALKDARDPAYNAEERRIYETARDEARRIADALPRFRPAAYSVSDVVPPQVPAVADTYLLHGGELAGKGEKVEPGFPQCISGKSEAAVIPYAGGSSGRRGALAEWIANAENPLTARVMVNRLWQHHFGEGIVRTASDFGMNGDRPSHPELLDWLAVQFVEKKWSIKAMHRLMVTSSAYRQSTEHPEAGAHAAKDPTNRLHWRRNWQRLEAEALRDSILSVSGSLRQFGGGPGMFLDIPADVAEGFEFFRWFPSPATDQLRKSIYAFQRRSVMMPMVEVFDGANMNESCSQRSATVVPTQAFSLLHSRFVQQQARHFAERVLELAGPDRAGQVEKAFQLALGRTPRARESAEASEALGRLPALDALTELAVVLFNLNEFVYVN